MKDQIDVNRIDQFEHEILHEGWLKKSPKRTLKVSCVKLKWRKRWFVLRHSSKLPGQHFLTYYTDNNRKQMKGQIDVGQIDHCKKNEGKFKIEDLKLKYMFDIKTPKRTYYLAAESEDDMNRWIDFLCHICDLKPFTNNENTESKERSTIDYSTSTNISSSSYIPINNCLSEKPKPLSPILPRPTLEKSHYTLRPLRILPLPLRLPPRCSVLSEHSPPSSDSESVFTNDESIKDCSSMRRPPIKWETFPLLPQNSPHIPIAVPPPRPPKPSYLTETPTKPLSGLRTTNISNRTLENIFTYEFKKENNKKVDGGKLKSLTSISPLSAIPNVNFTSLDQNQTPPDVPPKTNLKNELNTNKVKNPVISNSRRRHSTSYHRENHHDKVFLNQKMSSNLQYHSLSRDEARRSNDIKYLDLELELYNEHDYFCISQSNSPYGVIDLEKTQALIHTMKVTDIERRFGRHVNQKT